VASNVSCSGISKTVLHVTGAVDTIVDMVSVELRHGNASGPPNVHFTLAASAGRLDGRVTGLDQGAAYRLAVRTHRAGCAEDGANGTWSDLLSVSGACETLSEEAATAREAVPSVDVPEARVATRWLEVFRIAEANRSLPDFLDNHDSGDMGGDAAIASLAIGAPNLTLFDGPITRYCVELLDTTIANTTTTTFAGAPVDSAYADYRSTNPPWVVQQTYPGWMPFGEHTSGTEYAS